MYGDFTLSYNDKTKEYTLTTVDNVETENKDYYYYTSDGSSDTGATYTFKANEYLTPEIVDILLKQTDTDNSKLGYSGYSYYVYDRRASHSEFNPLGYWGGNSKQTEAYTETTDPPAIEKLIGHYTFDDTLKNDKSSSGEAKLINNITKGGTFDKDTTPSIKTEPEYVKGDDNTLDLAATAEKGGLMLDIDTPNKFTIAMRIKSSVSGQEKDVYEEIPLVYIGDPNGTNYIKVVRSSSDARNIKVYENGTLIINYGDSKTAATTMKPFHDTDWVNLCLSYDGSNLTIAEYDKNKNTSISKETVQRTLSGFSTDNAIIIIGGDIDGRSEKEYSPMQLTEFCVFDKALSDGELTTVNTNTNIKSYSTMSGIGNLVAYYDFGDPDNGVHEQLDNLVDTSKSLTFIKQAENGVFSKEEIQGSTELKPSYEGNALNLTQTAKNGGILLDAVPTNQNDFTISFKVKNDSDTPTQEAELVYMGPSDTSKHYYNIFRANGTSNNSAKHIRFSANSEYATRASGSNAFSQGDWTTVTFTVKDGTVKAYVNGEAVETAGGSTATLSQLTENDFAIILGGLQDNYNGKDILIDELFVYDKALDESEVSQLYKSLQEPKVIAAAANVALDDSGNPIAYIDAALVANKGEEEKMRGWYYVNSTSKWVENYDNPKVGTAKVLQALSTDEVIKNEINPPKLGLDQKEEQALTEAAVKGNGGFIYTGSDNFQTSGSDEHYYYDADTNDGKTTEYLTTVYAHDYSEKLNEHEGKAAITVPEGETRNGNDNVRPVIFFVDDAGYLRCFYSSSNSKTEPKNSTGPRSSASYVYFKWDCNDVKTDSLQAALGTFNADLEEISPSSRVSAVRFSSSEIEDKDLDKLVMLDWTKDPAAATKMLSLEYGEGESTGFDNSVPSLENENNSQSSIKQYNYGLTGGTSTYQGLKAFNEILRPRMTRDDPDRDEGKGKYVIIFTDGKDTNVEDLTSTDEDEKKAAQAKVDGSKEIAQTLKSDGFTIFYVLLKSGSFTVIDDAEKEFIASIAGNTDTSDRDYETLKNGGDDKKRYIFEATGGNDLNNIFRNDIARKELTVLHHHADLSSQRFEVEGGEVAAVVINRAALRRLKPQKKPHKRRFSAASCADYRDVLAGGYLQRKVVKNVGHVVVIAEGYVVDLDSSRDPRDDLFALRDLGNGVENGLCHFKNRLYVRDGEGDARYRAERARNHSVCGVEGVVIGD